MYEEFTQNRIAQLRTQRKVSAREMSLSLGQNDTYINKIENHKALPSLQGLFYICDYLRITPQEFFDEGTENPMVLKELIADLKRLDGDALSSVASVVKELLRKK
ncbi:MAG TPA: XRE family transcriptional regulator [Paenibacillaceae bacterium]|nr:XRE family transcriptional regulator [Paenibacillaceae bacterium]